MGNCGVTFAPCKPEDRGYLAAMMESVEDIPKESIDAGLPWDWETYGEYLQSVDRMDKVDLDQPPGVDLEQAYILTDDDLDYVHDRSRSLAAHAERTGQTEVAAFIELDRQHKGRVQIWHPGLNQSMDAIEEMILNPTVAMGLGDSGAHVGQIMDASSPTWLLSYCTLRS